jgi:hypothetical protein
MLLKKCTKTAQLATSLLRKTIWPYISKAKVSNSNDPKPSQGPDQAVDPRFCHNNVLSIMYYDK